MAKSEKKFRLFLQQLFQVCDEDDGDHVVMCESIYTN